jgi:hypothetical protein
MKTVPLTWHCAKAAKPDADESVLACNAKHGSYWLACWSGEPGLPCLGWYDPETMRPLPVTHWAALPPTP